MPDLYEGIEAKNQRHLLDRKEESLTWDKVLWLRSGHVGADDMVLHDLKIEQFSTENVNRAALLAEFLATLKKGYLSNWFGYGLDFDGDLLIDFEKWPWCWEETYSNGVKHWYQHNLSQPVYNEAAQYLGEAMIDEYLSFLPNLRGISLYDKGTITIPMARKGYIDPFGSIAPMQWRWEKQTLNAFRMYGAGNVEKIGESDVTDFANVHILRGLAIKAAADKRTMGYTWHANVNNGGLVSIATQLIHCERIKAHGITDFAFLGSTTNIGPEGSNYHLNTSVYPAICKVFDRGCDNLSDDGLEAIADEMPPTGCPCGGCSR